MMLAKPAMFAGASLFAILLVTSAPAVGAEAKVVRIPSAEPQQACAALNGLTISKASIALPTGGAIVSGTHFVASKTPGSEGYCSVDGKILPVDPKAPVIRFSVALPSAWNGKALHLMGGGWDGMVVKGDGPVVGAELNTPPVERAYAAFGSDSGHEYSMPDWQMNDEALENFAGDQLRKTRDVAVEIMKRRYGRGPRVTYSAGGSGGGREALYVADRWPSLYNGVIAFYPVWSAVGSFIGWIDNAQALATPGAWSNPQQQQFISQAVIAKCDGLDGLVDGLVGNVKACQVDPKSLRCADPQASTDTCLSEAQIAGLVRAYGTKRKLPFVLPNGVDSFFAYNVLNGGAQPRMGKTAPGGPITPDKSFAGPNETAFGAVLSDSFVRFVVKRDPAADLFKFHADETPQVRERMQYLAGRMDVEPTLKKFFAKDGKVLLVHGNSDQVHSADWSDEFYRRVQQAYGNQKAQSHFRYYRIPGFGHGIGLRQGAHFDFQADMLGALDNWVERGQAPAGLVATDDNAARNKRTRPMCEYPGYAKYNGNGDPDAAASFTCVNE